MGIFMTIIAGMLTTIAFVVILLIISIIEMITAGMWYHLLDMSGNLPKSKGWTVFLCHSLAIVSILFMLSLFYTVGKNIY